MNGDKQRKAVQNPNLGIKVSQKGLLHKVCTIEILNKFILLIIYPKLLLLINLIAWFLVRWYLINKFCYIFFLNQFYD